MKHLGKGSCRRPRWVGGWEERITIATTTLPCAATTTAAAIFQCGCWIGKIQQQQTVTLLPPQAILLSPPPSLSLSLSASFLSQKYTKAISQLLFPPYVHLGVLQGVVAKGRRSWKWIAALFFIFILPSLSLYLLLSLYNPSECLASRAADNRLVQVLTPSRSGVSSYRSLTSAKIDSFHCLHSADWCWMLPIEYVRHCSLTWNWCNCLLNEWCALFRAPLLGFHKLQISNPITHHVRELVVASVGKTTARSGDPSADERRPIQRIQRGSSAFLRRASPGQR